MSEQVQSKPEDWQSVRGRELREILRAVRAALVLFAIVVLSPLTAFAYRFSHGAHPRLIEAAFRNALLLVPAAFALIWLALWLGERIVAARSRRT